VERPSLAATVSEAKVRPPNCGSVSGTRDPKTVCPTTASQTGEGCEEKLIRKKEHYGR